VDGLAFLGLSLVRNHTQTSSNGDNDNNDNNNNKDTDNVKEPRSHPDSVTHQTAFDFNTVMDRDYQFVQSTNDDGWLVGGGERGPPHSYKLAAPDSAHVELMRIGTYDTKWGGVSQEEIVRYVIALLLRL
jgi:hypothetical protein